MLPLVIKCSTGSLLLGRDWLMTLWFDWKKIFQVCPQQSRGLPPHGAFSLCSEHCRLASFDRQLPNVLSSCSNVIRSLWSGTMWGCVCHLTRDIVASLLCSGCLPPSKTLLCCLISAYLMYRGLLPVGNCNGWGTHNTVIGMQFLERCFSCLGHL